MFSVPSAVSVPSLPPRVVLAAAVVIIAAAWVWQGVGLVSVWRGTELDGTRLAIRAAGSTGSGMGLEQVAKLHLFGEKANEPVVTAPLQTEIPKTDLKFILVGAMTNSDASKASALIATDKQTSRFFVGDTVAAGVVLKEVRADAVVLQRNGKLETLSFPRANESAMGVASGRATGLNRGVGSFAQPVGVTPERPLKMPNLHGEPRINAGAVGRLPTHSRNQ
ncbi:MAG: type II secretion system protein N [Pseudomonadales bacterium]